MRHLPLWLAAACLLTSCTSAPALQEPADAAVYADWSQLEDVPARTGPLYTYFEPYNGDDPLQPREDYGLLLPYIGIRNVVDGLDAEVDLFGLVTEGGALVTTPVYFSIRQISDLQGTPHFLLLYQAEGDPEWFAEGTFSTRAEDFVTLTVAAPDGSWTLSGAYDDAVAVDSRHIALYGWDESITVLDDSGQVVCLFSGEKLRRQAGGELLLGEEGGSYLEWVDGQGYLSYCDVRTGEISHFLLDPWSGSISKISAQSVPPKQSVGDWKVNGYYSDEILQTASWDGTDLTAKIESGLFCYTASDGSDVFRYPIRSNLD